MPRTTRASTRANARLIADIRESSESEAEDGNMDVDVEGKSEDDVEREANAEEEEEEEEEEEAEEEEEEEEEDGEAEGEDEIEPEDDNAPESEDDGSPSPPVAPPRLKIKLKLPQTTPSASMTPTPDASRAPSRAPQDSVSSRRIARDDIESEDEDEDESDEKPVGKTSRPLTSRQAVLASRIDSSHISLGEETQSKKKKQLTETEIALRREETARKRRNLTEKKLEDEKMETINRLLKKQSRKKIKNTPADDRTPASGVVTGGAGAGTPGQEGSAHEGSAEAEHVEPIAPVIPTMYRWISTTRPSVVEPATKVGTAAEGKAEECGVVMADAGQDTDKKEEKAATEGKMRLTFSVPVSVLSSAPPVPTPTPLLPVPKERPVCDVPGCAEVRKYRLVKDWMRGACGIAHLKELEQQLVIQT